MLLRPAHRRTLSLLIRSLARPRLHRLSAHRRTLPLLLRPAHRRTLSLLIRSLTRSWLHRLSTHRWTLPLLLRPAHRRALSLLIRSLARPRLHRLSTHRRTLPLLLRPAHRRTGSAGALGTYGHLAGTLRTDSQRLSRALSTGGGSLAGRTERLLRLLRSRRRALRRQRRPAGRLCRLGRLFRHAGLPGESTIDDRLLRIVEAGHMILDRYVVASQDVNNDLARRVIILG